MSAASYKTTQANDALKREHEGPHEALRGLKKLRLADVNYSDYYYDDVYEYRHVTIPKSTGEKLPRRTLTEYEWRSINIEMSMGWEHYMRHAPEPHILLFRRRIGTDPKTGHYSEAVEAATRKKIQASASEASV